MQKKVNVLVRKNRKQHHIQNQSRFLPWYLINGLECTVQNILISLNTLFELDMKSKKQVKYQQNLLLKRGKAIITEALHLVTNVFEDDNFIMQVLVKKDYVSERKLCQSLVSSLSLSESAQILLVNLPWGFFLKIFSSE